MKVAIVGITGVVGEKILEILDERNVGVAHIDGFASRDRVETIPFQNREIRIRAASPERLREGKYDAVFFASSDDASAALAQGCVTGGSIVIDNSATFRLDDKTPLVVPEVNPEAIQSHHRIFPVANCTAIVLCVGIAPILRTAGLAHLNVATYQAVSGAGRAGLEELEGGEEAIAADIPEPAPRVFAASIVRNVIPQVGSFDEFGDSGEEKKVAAETRKILNMPNLGISATTVRVPVRFAHSEVVFVETERDTTVEELSAAYEKAAGVAFHRTGIITPREVEGTDLVHVARLRSENGSKRRFQLWIVGDQVRKGAATNAVQLLELALSRGIVRRSSEK